MGIERQLENRSMMKYEFDECKGRDAKSPPFRKGEPENETSHFISTLSISGS